MIGSFPALTLGPFSSSLETQDSFPSLVPHGNKRQPFIEVAFGCCGTSFLVCFLNFSFLWPHIVHKWKPIHLTGNLDSLRIHPHSQATLPFQVVAIPAQDSFLQVQPSIRWPPEHLVQLVLSLVAGLTSLLLLLLVLSYSFMILQSQLQYYYSVKLFLYYSVVAAAVLVLGASFVASQVPFTVRYSLISLSQLPQVLSFREDLSSLSGHPSIQLEVWTP